MASNDDNTRAHRLDFGENNAEICADVSITYIFSESSPFIDESTS